MLLCYTMCVAHVNPRSTAHRPMGLLTYTDNSVDNGLALIMDRSNCVALHFQPGLVAPRVRLHLFRVGENTLNDAAKTIVFSTPSIRALHSARLGYVTRASFSLPD